MPKLAKTSGASPPAPVGPSAYPQRGAVVGEHYRLDALLGEGPSAVVYNAWHLEERRAFAVKVMHPELAALTAALIRMRHDNQEIAGIGHPHLSGGAVLFGEGEHPLLIRELWTASTLREHLADGAMDLPEVCRLFQALCGALDSAHRHGVVHGDLKPENLLLSQAGEDDVLKVVDFGTAHLRDIAGGIGSHPLLGTVSYRAPEQIQGEAAAVDGLADVFALGAILYECLTGHLAFDGLHPSAVVARICLGERPRPSESGLPAALDEVIARACHAQPGERYPTPRALWAALLSAVAEAPGVQEALPPPSAGSIREADPRWAAPTTPLWTRKRARPVARRTGAQAIQLFKELEGAAAHRRGEKSQELRKSTAEEAALRLGSGAHRQIALDETIARSQAQLHSAETPIQKAGEGEAPGEATHTPGDASLAALLRGRRSGPHAPLPPVLGLEVIAAGAAPARPPSEVTQISLPPAESARELRQEPGWLRHLPWVVVTALGLLVLLLVLLS